MDIGMFQKQTMKLAMTPELRQAISLLQYSNQALYDFVRDQALENPLIEWQSADYAAIDHMPSMVSKQPSRAVEPLPIKDQKSPSLQDYLLQQARFQSLSPNVYKNVVSLIRQVDSEGYLTKDVVTATADSLGVRQADLQEALEVLQRFEPCGVGARHLQECLLLQTAPYSDDDKPFLQALITSYLPLIAEQKWSLIADVLQCPTAVICDYVKLIQQMQPKPGEVFEHEAPTYIQPDLTVFIQDGKIVVDIHDAFLPNIAFNTAYRQLLTQPTQQTKQYMRDKYQHLLWLQKSIQKRRETLESVCDALMRRQFIFLQYGWQYLAPLTMKEIAEDVRVHESTVSRTVNNKYVQTPFGLCRLKDLFTATVSGRSASGNVSATRVKTLMADMVNHEDKQRPLSDQQMADQLKVANGIDISRRAVAKYRQSLRIASSAKRKWRAMSV